MVDGAADIGSRVDAGDDEIDVAEHAEAPKHGAQRRRRTDRPRLVDSLDVLLADIGLHVVERAQRSAVAGVLGVGGGDHHLTEGPHRPGQHMEADRVDTVVVGQCRATLWQQAPQRDVAADNLLRQWLATRCGDRYLEQAGVKRGNFGNAAAAGVGGAVGRAVGAGVGGCVSQGSGGTPVSNAGGAGVAVFGDATGVARTPCSKRMRFRAQRIAARATKGVRLIRLAQEDERLVGVERIAESDDEEEVEGEEE